MAQTQTLIRVGHSAYKGTNAMRLCFSKAQAVRVLCNRGIKRDDARIAVKKALTSPDGGSTVRGHYFEVVEIVNEDWSFRQGHYYQSYAEVRKNWAGRSEL